MGARAVGRLLRGLRNGLHTPVRNVTHPYTVVCKNIRHLGKAGGRHAPC